MSKKLKNMKWESVTLEGFPISTDNFDGFVGLEECTSYGLDKDSQKKNQEKKRKGVTEIAVPNKKAKLNPKIKIKSVNTKPNKKAKQKKLQEIKVVNGFVVESCQDLITPSHTNEGSIEISEAPLKNRELRKIKAQKDLLTGTTNIDTKLPSKDKVKQKKPKLGEENTHTSDLTPEDMLTWAEFKLQEPIMKALMELGFKKPTKIQQLSLPAAVHGRRDILGAAETGSGKTLAFGLPILSGILKLKEKAESKGLDVYDIPYKKGSAKKKAIEPVKEKKRRNKKLEVKSKESSEDGYSSGDDDDDDDTLVNTNQKHNVKSNSRDSKNKKPVKAKNKFKKAEDYLEEYDVPIKKQDTTVEDDSDDENYVHLSDKLDSDDLADSDEGSGDDVENNDDLSKDEIDDDISIGDGNDESGVEESDGMEEGSDEDVQDKGNPNKTGIGCVKVIDNIEIPSHMVMKTGKPLYALIMTPTRELAIQISRHLMAVAKYTGIKIATIVGGMAHVKQERLLRGGPEIVVATPGRLWELVTQGQPHLQQLNTVKFLAIDETDRMIERGHFDELTPLLERLNADEARQAQRQNFVFSATLTLVHDLPTHMKGKKVTKHGKIINRKIKKMTPEQKVKRLVDLLGMTEPKVVDITQQNLGTAETLTECKITCAMEHKDAYLYYILKRHPGRTLVFCNSIGSVKRLATLLTILKCSPLPLHASMPQRQRLKNLERFRDNPHGILIATDVAARGLDIPLVDHVVQYQVPRTAENYVHRSGRTARADREGINVLMVEPAEAYLYSKLCLTLNKTSEVPTFPVESHLLVPLKELVKVARECDALELRRRRHAQARGWREKAARDMDIIIDDDDCPTQEADPAIDRAVKARRKDLDAMLSRPVFPRGFSFKYPTLNDPMALSMPQENALQVMKRALETGQLKKEKRKSKNAPLLKLGKAVHKNRKQKNK